MARVLDFQNIILLGNNVQMHTRIKPKAEWYRCQNVACPTKCTQISWLYTIFCWNQTRKYTQTRIIDNTSPSQQRVVQQFICLCAHPYHNSNEFKCGNLNSLWNKKRKIETIYVVYCARLWARYIKPSVWKLGLEGWCRQTNNKNRYQIQ